MGVTIAQTAIVDPRAKLGKNVRIGNFCVIGPDVEIGDGTTLEDHVVICGITTIGENNHIYHGTVIGTPPQDISYKNTPTKVIIGDGNVFREHCTVNRASEKGDGITQVGDNNFLMTGCHVAHDCKVGDRTTMANNAMLGGHVQVHNDVTMGGGVGVSQFATIGQVSFVSGMARVLHDAPPFMIVEGQPARPRTPNLVGLKRHNYSQEDISVLTRACRLLYHEKVGIEAARNELFNRGPIRPVLVHLFDSLNYSSAGSRGRGQDRRNQKKAAA